MAQQLKQMEENRKKKAIEEEMQKREQLKMKKVQAVVDGLKDMREMMYRMGTKAMKGTLEVYLVNLGHKAKHLEGEEHPDSKSPADKHKQPGFLLGSKSSLDQLLYLLIAI